MSWETEVHWRVHTPNLLKEVLENPGTAILAKPLNIFGKLLAKVAERAIELNDDQLNKLMLQLTLYAQAGPADPTYDPAAMHRLLYGKPQVGDLDQGVPQSHDHTKRGFEPK